MQLCLYWNLKRGFILANNEVENVIHLAPLTGSQRCLGHVLHGFACRLQRSYDGIIVGYLRGLQKRG
jgi:hypothetical protein